jgi:hypothetical protein
VITEGERKKLSPLLEDENPRGTEWAMHCPYHGDSHRSASLNSDKRVWNCQGCDRSGPVDQLLRDHKNWDTGDWDQRGESEEPQEIITETKIEGWHEGLLSRKPRLEELMERKGLTLKTLRQYEIGWDPDQNAYTIPVRDMHGDIANVRRYQFDVPDERRKIWSVKGMGRPALYPIDQLEAPSILICEGEWDALLAIQNGIPAITRTGTADTWKKEWSHLFAGKKVLLCHDADRKGQVANQKITISLLRVVDSVTVVELPYEITAKNGKDLGDYFLEDGHTKNDFIKLAREAPKTKSLKEQLHPEDPEDEISISVGESFNPALVEKPLRMEVTVTGKRVPSHLVPKRLIMECDGEAGKRCDSCFLKGAGYQHEVMIDDDSPVILSMVDSPEYLIHQMIASDMGVAKCDRTKFHTAESRTVEEIYVRPSIEQRSDDVEDQDFTHRRVYSTVTHDLSSNQTIELVGTIRANPRNSLNEFQAWRVDKPVNTLDSFKMTPDIKEMLEVFQERDEPRKKLNDIADDMADHITRIYGRQDLHIFIDLTFHSALHIPFGVDNAPVKGWLDTLVMGDTRTGKSEVAGRLIELYGMGEMISCESATYAGVVGGLDRLPSGAWIVKWGIIPINDRRVVVLDEVSGLSTEQIAQMSNIRSLGVAEMTKINSERAMARTRLCWLANPRESSMENFTFGIHALKPLIGNPEDIARFDMAMGVFSTDVPSKVINRDHRIATDTKYSREAYRTLLQWAWTRRPEQIKFRGTCRQEIFHAATRLGDFYSQNPPLLQGANARMKIARIATAIAIRTFSTNATGEEVWVTTNHVLAAEEFLNDVYSHPGFGYVSVSRQQKEDTELSSLNISNIMEYLSNEEGLVRYLKANPTIEKRNMEAVMDMTSDKCTNVIARLWQLRAVRLDGKELKVESPVIAALRSAPNE